LEWIEQLRAAGSLTDLAAIINFTPSGLAHTIYKLDPKYTAFDIPKRNGGIRHIKAPVPQLKLAQKRLANLLYDCLDELLKKAPQRKPLAHGFVKQRSIMTNASLHKRRRYVLNLDLQDFFPSINFGRVRAVFMKDNNWVLNEKVATVIAQIACDEGSLPQGSPCSPIISNIVTHILDVYPTLRPRHARPTDMPAAPAANGEAALAPRCWHPR
jgi:RNA-directed DNA polymerase